MFHAKRPGAHNSDRAGNNVLGSAYSHTTTRLDPQRFFLGLDGLAYISDRLGTRRASGTALALLQRPILRLTGYREGVAHG